MSVKRKALGRGLDALLPKTEKLVEQVQIDQLQVSPYQPRKTIDPVSIAELASSIASKGVLQPLLVRKQGGGYEIVAGERRFRAAQEAGLKTVPVVVRNLSDQETLEIAIIENLQREDLSPLEEAQAFDRLMSFGMNQEEVAKAVSRSRSAVANTLRLLKLPEAAQQALSQGNISAGHARAILAQPQSHQLWALNEILTKGLSVRQAEELEVKAVKPGRSASKAASAYQELEEGLTRHLGTKVKLKGGKKGVLQLHFYSEDELERLLEVLDYQA